MLKVNIQRKQFTTSTGAVIPVLENLAFECEDRSFTCIVGPSGCGKTTALRCILGLDDEYQGTVEIFNNNGTAKTSAVFQEPRLLPWRTVEQNVSLALSVADKPSIETLLDELGLSAHRTFYPTELSLGLARRVSLARAFAVNPSLLILDEPFVSLDEATAIRLRQLLLKTWRERACTVLMVTHNLAEAIQLSDHILFFAGNPAAVSGSYRITLPRSERNPETVTNIQNAIRAQFLQHLPAER